MKTSTVLQWFRRLAGALLAGGLSLTAHASLLVYEGFNYTGNLIPAGGGHGQGTGSGWTSSWYTGLTVAGFPVESDSLHPPAAVIPPTGGRIRQAAGAYSAYRDFVPVTIPRGESRWFSVEVATSAEANFATKVFFRTSNPTAEGMVFTIGSPDGGPSRSWFFGPNQLTTVAWGPAVVPNAHTLLVAEVHRDPVADTFTFHYWVNPSPPADATGRPPEPPTVTGTSSRTDFQTFTSVGLVAAGVAAVHEFDEIRIGTSYADVNGTPSSTITVTTSASPPEGGTATGGGIYRAGDSVTVLATPSPGYHFVNWTEGDAAVSTSRSYAFIGTANRTLVAHFATCPAIAVTPPTLRDGSRDNPYSQPVSASGGTAPYRYTVTSGSLPPELTLSLEGLLSGTPTAGGDFNFTVTATDADGCAGQQPFSLRIQSLVIVCPPARSVQCLADVPAAATDAASFIAQGAHSARIVVRLPLPSSMRRPPAATVSRPSPAPIAPPTPAAARWSAPKPSRCRIPSRPRSAMSRPAFHWNATAHHPPSSRPRCGTTVIPLPRSSSSSCACPSHCAPTRTP